MTITAYDNNISSTDGLNINNAIGNTNSVVDLGSGSLVSTGGNTIIGNVVIDGLSGVTAQNNYWGQNTGLNAGDTTLSNGGSIDSSNHLTANPF